MYQPELTERVIRSLYRMKRAYHMPMTKILEELVTIGFDFSNGKEVCAACEKEGNNTACGECYFRPV